MPEATRVKTKPKQPVDRQFESSRQGIGDNHPLNDVIGSMEGDDWDKVLQSIKRNRKVVDRIYREQHSKQE